MAAVVTLRRWLALFHCVLGDHAPRLHATTGASGGWEFYRAKCRRCDAWLETLADAELWRDESRYVIKEAKYDHVSMHALKLARLAQRPK